MDVEQEQRDNHHHQQQPQKEIQIREQGGHQPEHTAATVPRPPFSESQLARKNFGQQGKTYQQHISN